MATDNAEAPEGFTKAAQPETTNTDDFDTEWVERPTESERLVGTLLALKPDRGDYNGLFEMRLSEPYEDLDDGDLIACWSTAGINNQIDEEEIQRGDEIAILVDEVWEHEGDTNRNYAVFKGGE